MEKPRVCVLVVDDEDDIREALEGILESEGYVVAGSENGAAALAHLREGPPPCVILLDLMMPVMDGFEFFAEKQRDPRLATIPVVVVSALGREDPRLARFEPEAHLRKPLDLDRLLGTVARFCPRNGAAHDPQR